MADGKSHERPRTPLFREIANPSTESGEVRAIKIKRQLIKRLIPCITASRPKRYIVEAVFRRVVNPAGFRKNEKWISMAGAVSSRCLRAHTCIT